MGHIETSTILHYRKVCPKLSYYGVNSLNKFVYYEIWGKHKNYSKYTNIKNIVY